jgi:hypothetical protein
MMEKLPGKIEYKEIERNDYWWAQQIVDGKLIRITKGFYTSREDLVTSIAFGQHQWTEWKPLKEFVQ